MSREITWKRGRTLLVLAFAAGAACAEPAQYETPTPTLDGAVDMQGPTVDSPTAADGPLDMQAPELDTASMGRAETQASEDTVAPNPDTGGAAPSCGNGVLESGETCDPPGSCPATCMNNGCTRSTLQGAAATCNARCVASTITTCTSGDGCCASGCSAATDMDCAVKCTGSCGDGLCPAGCEATASCTQDCGRLVFQGESSQRTNTGDWAPRDSYNVDYFKAECGRHQAMSGLSLVMGSKKAHALLCTADDEALPHATGGGCRSLNYFSGDVGVTTDWDTNFRKIQCAANEFVAGLAQHPNGALTHVLCCPGTARAQSCARVGLPTPAGNARETGAEAATGNWDPSYFQLECGPGRYVAGVSRYLNATADAEGGGGHALYCCGR
jgi:hypothetical protein